MSSCLIKRHNFCLEDEADVEDKNDFESVIREPRHLPEAQNDLYQESGRALYNAAMLVADQRFVDPGGIDKVLDGAKDACAIRKIAEAASLADDSILPRLKFSVEVNRARNEETLVIEQPYHHGSFSVHRYTRSPACQ